MRAHQIRPVVSRYREVSHFFSPLVHEDFGPKSVVVDQNLNFFLTGQKFRKIPMPHKIFMTICPYLASLLKAQSQVVSRK